MIDSMILLLFSLHCASDNVKYGTYFANKRRHDSCILLLHVPVYPFFLFCYLYFELLVLKNLVFLYCLLQTFTIMTAS